MSEEISVPLLSSLAPMTGARKRKKRVGCGEGSGHGKTSCRGTKGYGARSGSGRKKGFEGGQMPLQRRLPKVGFGSRKHHTGENVFQLVKVGQLNLLSSEELITVEKMVERRLVSTVRRPVKILSGGELKTKVVVQAHAVSAAALESIEKAGGQVQLLSQKSSQ